MNRTGEKMSVFIKIKSTSTATMCIIKAMLAFLMAISILACGSTPAQKPDEVLPPYESISYAITMGNPQKALEEYEKATLSGKETAESKILHARLLLIAGRPEDALTEINEVLAANPKNVDALYTLTLYYSLKENKKELTKTLEKITGIDKTFAPAYAYLGELALEDNKIDAAKNNFTKALENEPNNFIALTGLGNTLTRNKEYAKAIEIFAKAIEVDPGYSYNYNDRAKAKSLLHDWDGAVSDLTKAIEIAPDDYYSFIDRGKLYLDKDKKPEALADFMRASEIDPDFFLAFVFIGDINYGEKKYEAALPAYEKATALKPGYYFAYEPLGAMYYMKERWLDAERAFASGYKYSNDDPNWMLLAILSYKKAGMEKEAQSYITSVMNSLKQDSWYFDVARFYFNPANDVYALRRADSEKSPVEKKRILFYIAMQYLLSGKLKETALTYLLETENLERQELIEYTLASWELDKIKG
jgi:tetratricopeptide (TPR) repeat protein